LPEEREAFGASIRAGREIHVEQENVECVAPHELRQPRGIAERHHRREMALQQQACGEQDVFLIIEDEDSRGVTLCWRQCPNPNSYPLPLYTRGQSSAMQAI
jgi:hypothetical protein